MSMVKSIETPTDLSPFSYEGMKALQKQHIKPIETQYKGYRFRSRLEARWAVFFETLGIKWEYEPEGFDLEGVLYLPDFWLPQVKMFAEVKPDEFSEQETIKARLLSKTTGAPVLKLIGVPENKPYFAIEYVDTIDGPSDWFEYDYCLTTYHGYPFSEGRFYCMPGYGGDEVHDDTEQAAIAARSARFEHGERG